MRGARHASVWPPRAAPKGIAQQTRSHTNDSTTRDDDAQPGATRSPSQRYTCHLPELTASRATPRLGTQPTSTTQPPPAVNTLPSSSRHPTRGSTTPPPTTPHRPSIPPPHRHLKTSPSPALHPSRPLSLPHVPHPLAAPEPAATAGPPRCPRSSRHGRARPTRR